MASDRFLKEQESLGKIGGPGITVQLDESKFGKRKYNKGRRTEGHWVLGMIAEGSEDLRKKIRVRGLSRVRGEIRRQARGVHVAQADGEGEE